MIWKDIDITFKKALNGDISTDVSEEAIKNSLINIFSTIVGDRRMLMEFAMPMHGLLFEQIDDFTSSNIASLILGSIKVWETRILIQSLNVFADPDTNKYIISLFYKIAGDDEEIKRFDYALGDK